MRYFLPIVMLALAGCGYVGDPMPPALKVPLAVSDLTVAQRGANLIVEFTLPDKTLEGLELTEFGGIELKIGPDAIPFNADLWSGLARTSDQDATAPGKVSAKIPVKDWAGQNVVLGVRSLSVRKRLSPWSNFVRLKVQPALETPANLRAVAAAEGVVLDWSSLTAQKGLQWTLYRQSPKDKEATEMGKISEPRFVDTGAEYGVEYKYTVQASLEGALSEVSEAFSLSPVDKFPPAVPQGITALSSATAVIVTWDRNSEADLAMYRIFRAIGDGPLQQVAESPSAASYSDSKVKSGERYRYAVSAVDKLGNESQQSKIVEIQQP